MLSVSSKQAAPLKKPEPHAVYPWSIFSTVLVILISFMVLPIITQMIIGAIPSIMGWDSARGSQWISHSTLSNFLYVLIAELLTVSLLVWFVRLKKKSFWQTVALRRPCWKDAGYAGVGILCYFGLFIVVLTVVNLLLPIDTEQQQAIGFERGISGINLGLAFVSLVVLPPIVEEMIFRGYFFGTLRAHKFRLPLAILLTSLFFGALHLFGGGAGSSLLWIAFLDTFVLSVVLCYLREKTGSIWASIAVHALKNGFVFLNLFIISPR